MKTNNTIKYVKACVMYVTGLALCAIAGTTIGALIERKDLTTFVETTLADKIDESDNVVNVADLNGTIDE